MKYSLFLSDLHLQAAAPQITAAFQRFLEKEAPGAERVYILGDLFNYWIGDDHQDPFFHSIEAQLAACTRQGTPIYCMPGNRDFLLGADFAKRTGVTLLPDPFCIDLYGRRTVLTHGDALCTLDLQHQRFRKWSRHPYFRRLAAHLPRLVRLYFAGQLRRHSAARAQNLMKTSLPTYATIADITPSAAFEMLRTFDATQMIHGHTHRPKIWKYDSQGLSLQRIVLGSWEPTGEILYADEDGGLLLTSIFP